MEAFWKEEQPVFMAVSFLRFGRQQNTQHALAAWLVLEKEKKGG
jgi:hypothetical protein